MTSLPDIRHSLSHILLMAVKKHFPHAVPTLGPSIDTGFYYDIDFSTGAKVTQEDFSQLEATMREIIRENISFTHKEVSADEARDLFHDNKYKKELIDNLEKEGKTITIYYTGDDFYDLCAGGHVEKTGEIDVDCFKLDTVAGAYWRGDEKREQLTRIYGLAFDSKKELEDYIHNREEAKKRDHRILGKQLKLFTFSDLVGPGLPLWTPRGTIVREELNDFVWALRKQHGYQKVTIPHITKSSLYEKSGHWAKYAEDLFKIDTRDGHTFCMKPMNCPHHAQIYASELRSYKELPLRFCETTMVYRDEQSGELSGLARVLSITQDDAHVFCRESQLEKEISTVWDIIQAFYSTFGFTLIPRFSRRDTQKKEKYLGSDETWDKAESAIKALLEKKANGLWVDGEGEAAFYGPKVDFMAKDSLGRTWQVATIQVDFVQPANFGLEFINEEGKREQPVMIHCAIMGALERFISILTEHTGGDFPLWLSPIHVGILPISDKHHAYAQDVVTKLKDAGLRVEFDQSKDGLGKKVRDQKEMKNPYWIVIGDKDIEASKVTLESRDRGNLGQLSVDEVLSQLLSEIKNKRIEG